MHVVFVRPEIPPNSGTTARLCVATATTFHLVGPLGFSLDDRYLKRAGLDYWPHVDLRVYDSWEMFLETRPGGRLLLFSARASRSYTDVRYQSTDLLVFGSETQGLSESIKNEFSKDLLTIPMLTEHVRSLNLSTATAIVLYEALRQLGQV